MTTTTTKTDLVPFQFDGNPLRTVQRGGEPWFIAADVLAILGIGNVTDALARVDPEDRGFDSIETDQGKREVSVVNESGLYALIFGSRKPEAQRFKRWVTKEVLPAIRSSGGYSAGMTKDDLEDPLLLQMEQTRQLRIRQNAQEREDRKSVV